MAEVVGSKLGSPFKWYWWGKSSLRRCLSSKSLKKMKEPDLDIWERTFQVEGSTNTKDMR